MWFNGISPNFCGIGGEIVEKISLRDIPEIFIPPTLWQNFSWKGCVIGVYQHNSLMKAYDALRQSYDFSKMEQANDFARV